MTDCANLWCPLLLLLLAAARSGSALRCYESTCTEQLTDCVHDRRAQLKDCTFESFRRTVERLDSPFPSLGLANRSMMCITHGAEGIVSQTGSTQDVMLRMCFPDVAGVCDFLSQTTDAIFRGHGVIVKSGCHFCHVDGCNQPPPPPPPPDEDYSADAASAGASPVALLLAACLASSAWS
ncbi:uncharacterized protein LOC134539815 [Bacillus rossius redtenbacheri]|uniref:uncharacterized protein LOC134539815 n=1 Tax=Bacillus rossius redtenbacheri TaxID=93214 RepID=UPI002FDEA5BF